MRFRKNGGIDRLRLSESPTRAARLIFALTLAGCLLWLLAIFAPPLLASRGAGRAAVLFYAIFSPTCHQIPDRCFAWQGHPLAVCGRCLGIYAGFLGGLAAYAFIRGFSRLELPSLRSFLLLSLPIGADGAANLLGLWASPIGLRFATGFLWGTILPFYFVTAVAELAASRKKRAGGGASPAPVPSPGIHYPVEKDTERDVE